MDSSLLDWFGYAASVVILISLMMSSIVRLRWINLAGAIMFSAFGYMIGSIPTGTLNLGIAVIDVYYLVRLYRSRDELAIVAADPASAIFAHFWQVNRQEIGRIFGIDSVRPGQSSFYFLRNNYTAGILVGHETEAERFHIDIDYVTPEYRDFAIGLHFIAEARIKTVLPNVSILETDGGQRHHAAYLKKMGFRPATSGSSLWIKEV